jgi:hypothetical protein
MFHHHNYTKLRHLIYLREDKTISIQPFRVLRVKVHELAEENMRGGSQTHWGTGMTGISFGGGIDLEDAD